MEGNLRFKIDCASLIVRRKFTVFTLFYFVFEGNFQVQASRGAYIWRGDSTEGFLRYEFGGLIFGGAYFRNFTVPPLMQKVKTNKLVELFFSWCYPRKDEVLNSISYLLASVKRAVNKLVKTYPWSSKVFNEFNI